jgi:putative heme-binding domain-containing protein
MVITEGIPGTTMPGFKANEDEEEDVLAYVLSLSKTAASSAPHAGGDAARGSAVYERNGCAACHLIGDKGSVFGPELTRVGVGRSYDYLKQSLLDPSADITPGAEGITVVTLDGKRTVGIRVNEDAFTVQLRDASQQFVMFDKSELKTVTHETKSLMPSYSILPTQDLEDLLAYLSSLHGDVNAGAGTSPRALR